MKALFVRDSKFCLDQAGNTVTEGHLSYDILQRYLKHFDEIIVVGRSSLFNEEKTYKISSGEGAKFVLMPSLASLKGMLRYRAEIKKKLHELVSSVDAVIIRSSLLGKLAAPIARKTGTPWAVEMGGCAWDTYWNYGSVQSKIWAPVAYHLQRKIVSNAPYAIYVTKNFLQNRYPCSGVTSYASNVEISAPDSFLMKKRIKRVSNPGNPFIFGLIGSLQTKYKGIQTALAAFKKIKNRLPEFELQILGEGDRAPWRRLAKSLDLEKNTRFLGTLPPGPPVLTWLSTVDVYLQPSFQEGLPRALAEATSQACPAIGSTAGGIPELLETGSMCKPGDINGLSGLILKSLSPQWRKEQAEKNFDASKRYTKEALDARRDEFWADFAQYARKHLQEKTT
ncbi:MAG: glycosyltransferase [Candidatus Electrothrix sp. GM3_4]|nr:glycosyltransferase [Candidatus Electrothrix sp. GM3_4]